MNTRWRRLLLSCAVVLLLMVAGEISNTVSMPSAERAVMTEFLSRLPPGRKVKCKPGQDELTHHWLLESGVEIAYVSEDEYRANPFPSFRIGQAVPSMPFVSALYCMKSAGPLGIWAGRVYVLNLFGWSTIIWQETHVQS